MVSFFDYDSNSSIAFSGDGGAISAWFDTDAVDSSGSFDSDINLNGQITHNFEVGLQFGEPGIGKNKGDYQTVSFNISSADDIVLGDLFGGRLKSVGWNVELTDENGREDSSKLLGEREDDPPTTGTVPEPTTLMLFSSALVGAFVKQRFLG